MIRFAPCAVLAALLMATSTAHAFPSYKKCGEVFVRARIGGHSGADGNRFWTWEWYFEKKPPFNFKCNNKEDCWLNGKFCRFVTDDEWKKEHPDKDD